MQRGDPMELNFEGFEMQKWKIPTDRAQMGDEKNQVVCLVIMFTPGIMVIKCQKWLIICIFCWWQQKASHSLGRIFRCIWKILFSSFRKCCGLLDSELPLTGCKSLKIQDFGIFLLTQQFFDVFSLDIFQTVTPKPINHSVFWKSSVRSFRCT